MKLFYIAIPVVIAVIVGATSHSKATPLQGSNVQLQPASVVLQGSAYQLQPAIDVQPQ